MVAAQGGDSVDNVCGGWEFRPVRATKETSSGKTHEEVGTLGVTGGPKVDGSGGAGSHILVMFFVDLGVGAERDADVFGVVKLLAGHEVSRGEGRRKTITGWDGIQPENNVGDHASKDDAREISKRQSIVAAPDAVFNSSDVSFYVRDVFIGPT